jgi:nucleotide-binding universal stress UspA family protein
MARAAGSGHLSPTKERTMTVQSRRPVVVGVDDRPSSRVVLDWAIDEAVRRSSPLHVLHSREDASGPPSTAALVEAVAHVHGVARMLEVSTEISPLRPSLALVEASKRADCLVVGAPAHAPLVGALLGTTSLEVAAHAACPVVVVRQFPEINVSRPGVVVGADGSELSVQAIGYAFGEAAARMLPLTVVHVWSAELDRTARTGQEDALAAEEVAGWAETYPDVSVHRHVLRGHPVKALVDHSRGAELVVVGSRGLGGFAGLLLGSVSQGVLQHAHCPVAVVRSAGN